MNRFPLALALAAACGGPSKPAATPSNATPPGTATIPLDRQILESVLASQRPLPAETHRDDECGGAPTLGALVKSELDKRKQPIVAKCNEMPDVLNGGPTTYNCYVFIGPDDPNPDPSDENWRPTQFSVNWDAAKPDGSEMLTGGMLECRWM